MVSNVNLCHYVTVVAYHGKMDEQERRHKQREWCSGAARIIVCNSAFGEGIDNKNADW